MLDSIASRYASHVARLEREIAEVLALHEFDALVIHSGREAPVSQFDDRYWKYKPTPAFAHLAPIAEPNAAFLIEPGKKLGLYRPPYETYWDAPPPAPPSWCLEHFREISPADTPKRRVAFVGEQVEFLADWGVEADTFNPAKLLTSLDAIRAIKSDYEVECLAEANRIAARGHVALANAFTGKDSSELALHLAYLVATDQDDADTPYKGIVALGRNAAVLHHNRYGREATLEKSLLVDAGAEIRGYAADITRTYAKGEGSQSFNDLIDAIDTLQQKICSEVEPGLSFEVLHDRTHQLLAETLVELEVATASTDELIETGVTRALFPHGLGHSLGIQVHDVGCKIKPPTERNPFLRNTADIMVGHVFTVEPGCYFIDSLLDPLREAPIAANINWPQIAELHPYGGIRIEDNLAVTANKTRNLTRDNWPSAP